MTPKRIVALAVLTLGMSACAAPAAHADISLTDSSGVLEAGAKVTATSTNLVTTRPTGTKFECEKVTFHFELIDPGPEHLELKQLGVAIAKGCILNREAIGLPNLPMTVDDATIGVGAGNTMTINTWGTSTTSYTFVGTIVTGECHTIVIAACDFAGTLDIEAGQTTDELKIAPSKLTDIACGEMTVHGDFTLETPGPPVEPIVIHYESTP